MLDNEKELHDEELPETPETIDSEDNSEEPAVTAEEEALPAAPDEEDEIEEEDHEDEEPLELHLEQLISHDTAHDDFNWGIVNKHGQAYTKEEFAGFLEQYDSTLSSV